MLHPEKNTNAQNSTRFLTVVQGRQSQPSMQLRKLLSNYLIRRGFDRTIGSIKKLNGTRMNARETVDLLFSKPFELIQPWQFKEELMALAMEFESLKPSIVVEIGTANGGTLFMATRLATSDALIVSIDLPGGAFGGGYPDWKIPYYKGFARESQRIELLRGNSQDPSIRQKLLELLDGRKIDYLFIDGDHTYEGVKADHVTYSPLVRQGGKIVFHDIVPHPSSNCKVDQYWQELRSLPGAHEHVRSWDQKHYGIGILDV